MPPEALRWRACDARAQGMRSAFRPSHGLQRRSRAIEEGAHLIGLLLQRLIGAERLDRRPHLCDLVAYRRVSCPLQIGHQIRGRREDVVRRSRVRLVGGAAAAQRVGTLSEFDQTAPLRRGRAIVALDHRAERLCQPPDALVNVLVLRLLIR
jgi:hypothetical protein